MQIPKPLSADFKVFIPSSLLHARCSMWQSCGTMLIAEGGKFEAMGPGFLRDEMGTQEKFSRSRDSGVIDVEAIDVDD